MFVNQKAQEISLAIMRLAVYVRRVGLRSRLETIAAQLLEEVLGRQYEMAAGTIIVLNGMISLAKSLYEIQPSSGDLVLGWLESLNLEVRKMAGLDKLLSSEEEFSENRESHQISNNNDSGNSDLYAGINHKSLNGNGTGNGNGNSAINMAIRQSAIIEKIRQSGKASLKDILTEFPEVSERTIRYDLQKLCGQGVIERIGNGGPSTYYQNSLSGN